LNSVCPAGSEHSIPILVRKVLVPDWSTIGDGKRRKLLRKLLREYHLDFPWIVEAVYTSVEFWVEHAGDVPPHPWEDRFVFEHGSDPCGIDPRGNLFEFHPVEGKRPLPLHVPGDQFGHTGTHPDPYEMSRDDFKEWAVSTWNEHDDRAAQSPRVEKPDVRVRKTNPEARARALAVWQVDPTTSKSQLARELGVERSTLDAILKAEASILRIDLRPADGSAGV